MRKRTDFYLVTLQRAARKAGPAFRELYHAGSMARASWMTDDVIVSLVIALEEVGDLYD